MIFLEEIQKKVNQVSELKEKINEYENKISHMQQLYETARSERSSLQTVVQACSEERDDLKKRLRTVTKQAEQAKEELMAREADQTKLHKNLDRAEKEKVALKSEIQSTLTTLQHIKSEMKEKHLQIERMRKTVMDCDAKVQKLQKQLDMAVSEKDLISGQLLARTEEIALVNEKLQDLQLALDRSEAQYARRLDDIKLLKVEISGLRSQVKLLSRGLSNTTDMRQEVLQVIKKNDDKRIISPIFYKLCGLINNCNFIKPLLKVKRVSRFYW